LLQTHLSCTTQSFKKAYTISDGINASKVWHLNILVIATWGLYDIGRSGGSILSPVNEDEISVTAMVGTMNRLRAVFRQLAMIILVDIGVLWAFILIMLPEWPSLSGRVATIALTFLWFLFYSTFIVVGAMF
jgi:hypothetical protein